MRQECDVERGLLQCHPRIGGERAEMAAQRNTTPARHDAGQDGQQRGQQYRQQDEANPHRGCTDRHRQARQQCQHAGGRRQRSPQIVEHFPAAHRRNGVADPIRAADRSVADQPRQQLPVAARPAMVPPRGDVVTGRKLFDDFDIGDETRAGEHALEQVVAEQGRIRHAIGERGLECIDVVDALAGIGAFAEHVLVNVGDRGGVRVDAVHAGEHALEQGTLAADRQ